MACIRALVLVVSLLWQQVAAQDGENNFVILTGRTTYEVTAGQPLTVEWTNPSSSTVTIKLQQEPPTTPDGGIILTTGIPASTLIATLTIPAAEDLNSSLYVLEIIDDIDPNNHNFSPNFSIDLVTSSASTSISETLVTSSTPITTSTYDDSGPGTKRSETSGAPSTADQTGTSESNEDRPALSTELIVIIAVSGAVGVFVVGALWFFMVRQNRKGKKMWDTALNAVEESHTNGLSFTVEPAQDRFGRDREGSGQDTDRTYRSEVPVSYRLRGTMPPSSHELLSMLRTV